MGHREKNAESPSGIRILLLSCTYPSLKEASAGIFVYRSLIGMQRLGGAEFVVIVPLAWCPKFLRRFRRWAKYDHTRTLVEAEGVQAVGLPYFRPPGNWFNRWGGLSVYLSAIRKIKRIHAKKPFDLIYSNSFFPEGDAAFRVGKELGVPSACAGTGTDVNVTAWSSKTIQARFEKVVRGLDGCVGRGSVIAATLHRISGRITPNIFGFVDLREFAPANPKEKKSLRKELRFREGTLFLTYAGHILRTKGLFELVDAIVQIKDRFPSVVVNICGFGDSKDLEAYIRGKGMDGVVRLVGEIEPQDLPHWLRASDLFVLPSYSEGMPNAVMEAMGCGIPVITTSVGGIPDALGKCGGVTLIPPKDALALARAIENLVSDSERMAQMGELCRIWAIEHFDMIENSRVELEYLRSLVGKVLASPRG